MDKALATYLLGGTDEQAARWIGTKPALYREWPDSLHRIMADRVWAAVIRMQAAKAHGWTARQALTDWRCEAIIEKMLTRVSLAAVMTDTMPVVPAEYERRGPLDDRPPEPPPERKRPGRGERGSMQGAPSSSATMPG